MVVLDAGSRVAHLRFHPDGRLFVGARLRTTGAAVVELWALPAGDRVRVRRPGATAWTDTTQLAAPPGGDRVYLAPGRLACHSLADGRRVAGYPAPRAAQVITAADRLVVAYWAGLTGVTHLAGLAADGTELWRERGPRGGFHQVVGFLPDGDRFVLVGGRRVVVRTFTGAEVAAAPYPSVEAHRPQLSPDGRLAGMIGHDGLYVYDTHNPGETRTIRARSHGEPFVGFAFHPAGRTLAVIHGGPTLVKLYDLDTLTLRAKLNWKVGRLTCVAYSADGLLGAAGSEDGRVVIWDVDE